MKRPVAERPPGNFAVIADDVTGACELAGSAKRCGWEAIVYLSFEQAEFSSSHPAIPVVSTDSRHCPPQEAAARVRRVHQVLRKAGYRRFYKKCDSTLRGNIGAELAALLEGNSTQRLIYGPAFPAADRVVLDGQLLVGGQPVATTAFCKDPLAPVLESNIAAVVMSQVRNVPVSQANLALETVATEGIIIFDGTTDSDLFDLAKRFHLDTYFAGPGQFFESLLLVTIPAPIPPQVLELPKRWLVVVGSQHPVTLNQLQELITHGATSLQLPASDIAHIFDHPALPAGWLDAAEKAWQAGRCVVVHTATTTEDLAFYHTIRASLGLTLQDFASRLTRSLANLAVQLATHAEVSLMICGGETAQEVMRGLSFTRLKAVEAPACGVTLLKDCSPDRRQFVLTKNGGFGPPELLRRLIERYQ